MGTCAGSGPKKPTETVKILCLGIGGCGKTTFVRQMKIMHKIPWEKEELEKYSSIIKRCFVMTQKEIITIAKKFNIQFPSKVQALIDEINESTKDRENLNISETNLPLLKAFWEEEITQKIVTEHNDKLSAVHIRYFWENVDRIVKSDYLPTDEDLLRMRVRTAGAYSTVVQAEKACFEFFDVGGQKPERAKWEKVLETHAFSCILYFVAADEWDVKDIETEYDETKMEMSQLIFKELFDTPQIQKIPIVLFLNRSDLFEKRIKNDESWESFKQKYKNYKGERDAQEAMQHQISEFKDKHECKHYITNALDKDAMLPIWKAVKEFKFDSAFDDLGF